LVFAEKIDRGERGDHRGEHLDEFEAALRAGD
jgi:hypothetical protein